MSDDDGRWLVQCEGRSLYLGIHTEPYIECCVGRLGFAIHPRREYASLAERHFGRRPIVQLGRWQLWRIR